MERILWSLIVVVPGPNTPDNEGFVYNFAADPFPECSNVVIKRLAAPRYVRNKAQKGYAAAGARAKTFKVAVTLRNTDRLVKHGGQAATTGPLSVTLALPLGVEYISNRVMPRRRKEAAADYNVTAGAGLVTWVGAPVSARKTRKFETTLKATGAGPFSFQVQVYKMDLATGLPTCQAKAVAPAQSMVKSRKPH